MKLLSLFSFFVNKNLFLERFSFLRKLKISIQNGIYALYFIFSRYVVWCIIFALWYFFKWPTFILSSLLIMYLGLKLILLDIDDWQIYFNDDIHLAFPNNSKRFFIVLLNILVYKFLIEDNVFIYILALKFITSINDIALVFILIAYLSISAFILSFYFVQKVGSIKLKSFYSIFSYLSAMVSMFLFSGIVIKLITYVVNSIYSLILGTFIFDFNDLLNKATLKYNDFYSNNCSFIIISLFATLVSLLAILLIIRNINLEVLDERPLLYLQKSVKKTVLFNVKDIFKKCLAIKDCELILDVYKYNFKQYYFTFFLDRTYCILIALVLSFINLSLDCKNLLFFGFSIIIFIIEIDSVMGNKLIANLSFITDYNTLRQFNCNGINIQTLSDAKLRLFYNIRRIPTAIFIITVTIGHFIINSSFYFIIINILTLLTIYLTYPKDCFTKNLICTRMDYKNFENYLTEKNILESGTKDFYLLNWLYNFLLYSLLFSSVISSIFCNFSTLSNIICICLFITCPLLCHMFMKKIYKNIIDFIERGDYSADFSKIFKRN